MFHNLPKDCRCQPFLSFDYGYIIYLFSVCAKLFKKIFLPSKLLKTAKNYNFFHVYGGYFELSRSLCFQFFPYASNLPHFPKFPNRPPSLSLFVALIEKNTSLTSTFTSTSTPQNTQQTLIHITLKVIHNQSKLIHISSTFHPHSIHTLFIFPSAFNHPFELNNLHSHVPIFPHNLPS